MTPTELNEIKDDRLFSFLEMALCVGTQNDLENVDPFAPYITLEILYKIHERIVAWKKEGRLTSSKHKLLARAVMRFMGVHVPPDERDVDKVGNHLDIWLKRKYVDEVKRITRNIRSGTRRDELLAELRSRCCVVSSFGGVEEHHQFDAAAGQQICRSLQKPYVAPTRPVLPPHMTLLELRAELNGARAEATSASAQCQRERERRECAKRRYESAEADAAAAKRLVVLSRQENVSIKEQADEVTQWKENAEVKLKALRDAKVEFEKKLGFATQKCRGLEAQVLKLGGQAAKQAQEAAAFAQREERAQRQRLEEQHRAEVQLDLLRQQTKEVERDSASAVRDAEAKVRDAEAKVLRLGGQAAMQAREAGQLAEAVERARMKLESQQELAEAELKEHLRQRKDGYCICSPAIL